MSEPLPEHYASHEQLDDAVTAGMWVFLATEAMLFGAVFAAYTAYRVWFPQAFADGSQKLHLELATLNTAILLTSSLFMALADVTAQRQRRRVTLLLLGITALLGTVFLGIKFYEWFKEYQEHLVPLHGLLFEYPEGTSTQFQVFFNIYYVATGLHAMHLSIGIGLVGAMMFYTWRWRQSERISRRVTATGLYWHFVDVIWVFLYPILYLV